MKVMKQEPSSVEDAQLQRIRVIGQIHDLQGWLAGNGLDGRYVHMHDYQRGRADKVRELSALHLRASQLKTWIHAKNAAKSDEENSVRKMQLPLLVELFHAVCDLEDAGTNVGSQVQKVLDEIEQSLPPRVLERRRAG